MMTSTFETLLQSSEPILALAPMQDVTDLAFWRLLARYGGPDVYWTEYFRVHRDSRLESWILESLVQNPTGRPAIAQLIGNDPEAMRRAARELLQFPVAAIDLNLGCPAPVVYRKCAGGGLLRDLSRVDRLLGTLREAVPIAFTVKTRLGFETSTVLDELLPLFDKHKVDLVTVHGRTVTQMYRPGVRYDLIAKAARALSIPVLANGDISGPQQAAAVVRDCTVRGLMIGRGAVRNPWIFNQIRQHFRGEAVQYPTGRQVLEYIHALWESQANPGFPEATLTQRMKKFMNFIGEGVPPADRFLYEIRRVSGEAEFFRVCASYLEHDESMTLVPAASLAPSVHSDAVTRIASRGPVATSDLVPGL